MNISDDALFQKPRCAY